MRGDRGVEAPRSRDLRHGIPAPARWRSGVEAWWFVVIALGTTWVAAGLTPGAGGGEPEAVLAMVLAAAWQPLLAAWFAERSGRWPSREALGLEGSRRELWIPSAAAAGALVLGAAASRWPFPPGGPAGAVESPSLPTAAGRFLLLWGGAVGIEAGWRGYLQPRLQRTLGPWRGIWFQGGLWAAAYLPWVLRAHSLPEGRGAGAACLLADLLLCGVVLGWIRWRSGSVLPGALAHAVLLAAGGLFHLFQEGDPGPWNAIFGAEGLLLWGAAIAGILAFERIRGGRRP